MIFRTYSDKLKQKRRKTRRAFVTSLLLHAIAIGILSLTYIKWYRPMLSAQPLLSEAITVTNIQRFHTNSTRKRPMPTARRSISSTTEVPQLGNQRAVRLNSTQPIAASPSAFTIGTKARLPVAETALSEHLTESPQLTARRNVPTPFKIGPPLDVKQEETAQQGTPTTLQNAPQPVNRDARMGEALEGIAESIADGGEEKSVDIVFLLDISGSMIDNIRAVGRQLSRMVTVFEEKGVDFTLGIVIFRYLEGDTIIHPQTRDSEKYKRLLTSHVVAAAGDERAHNAIVKTIRRTDFREEAKRRFILVTDEASKGSYSLSDVLVQCWQNQITVDVIGINHTTHRALTVKTGGLWYPIPKQE